MADFIIAYKRTAPNEGFYSNDPTDPGGETLYGIARTRNPKWKGWPIVDLYKSKPGNLVDLLKADKSLEKLAMDFYKVNFWDKIRGDEIKNQDKANSLYDACVNFGIAPAVSMAQKALDLAPTGIMNNVTLNKLNK